MGAGTGHGCLLPLGDLKGRVYKEGFKQCWQSRAVCMGGRQAAGKEMAGAALEPGLRCCWYQPMPDALWSENCGRMLGTDSWEDALARQCCPNYFLQEGAAMLYCWETFGVS